MGVYVGFEIEVSGHNPEHEMAVINAIHESAPFNLDDDWSGGNPNEGGRVLAYSGESTCSYSLLEETVLRDEIVPAITQANGGETPHIEVTIRWLEHTPYDTFCLSEDEDDDA